MTDEEFDRSGNLAEGNTSSGLEGGEDNIDDLVEDDGTGAQVEVVYPDIDDPELNHLFEEDPADTAKPTTQLGRALKNMLDWQAEGPPEATQHDESKLVKPDDADAKPQHMGTAPGDTEKQATGNIAVSSGPKVAAQDNSPTGPVQQGGTSSNGSSPKRRKSADEGEVAGGDVQGPGKRARSATPPTRTDQGRGDTTKGNAETESLDNGTSKHDLPNEEETLEQRWTDFTERARSVGPPIFELSSALHLRARAIHEQGGSAIFPLAHEELSVSDMAQEARQRVVKAERPFAETAWRKYISSLLAGGKTEAHKWAELMFRGVQASMDGGASPTMPPKQLEKAGTPPPSPPAPPLPPNYGAQARELGFDGAQASLEGHWNFKETIGQTWKQGNGIDGHVGLWVKVDADGTIIESVVVKETYTDALKVAKWNIPQIWYGDPEKGQPLPREVLMHRTLSQAKPSTNVVRFLGSAVHLDRKMYRVYMEHCPHGDLENLIEEYAARNEMMDKDGQKLDIRIPELALWGIFESLVNVACLMKNGTSPAPILPPPPPPKAGWKTVESIIHRDLKPQNVFLSTPNSRVWRFMPTIKVGDFGVAIHQKDKFLRRNPEDYRGLGTPGYMAPEQRPYDPELYKQHIFIGTTEVTSCADIYAIGRILISLMDLTRCENTAPYGYDQGLGKEIVPSDAAQRYYSPELVKLVAGCCKPLPASRTQAEKLWRMIRAHTERFDPETEALPPRLQDLDQGHSLYYKDADKYLGLAK